MSSSVAESVAPIAASSQKRAGELWPLGALVASVALLWFEAINQLRPEWTLNPQYNYGWIVPVFALFLFSLRWKTRPPPAATAWKLPTILIALVAAAALLPGRIIAIANPDWRLVSWGIALAVIVISFCLLHLAGGWPWVRHFAFPVLFFIVAIPWPAQFEQGVVQALMRADAAITIRMLNALGMIAIQHGNVIELSTGMVGIDDACTGIRSLQATLMMALFLGEYHAMTWRGRGLLLLAGTAFAFLCNLGRTFILCLVGGTYGIQSIHRWHDSAGMTILFISVIGLWLLSLYLRPPQVPDSHAAGALSFKFSRTLIVSAAALLVWLGSIEIAAAAWYRRGDATREIGAAWDISWPTDEPKYATTPVPEAAQELLRYNEGGGANWESADAKRWAMFYFRWLPGRTAALFVKNHRPDICLPASGMTMEKDAGIKFLTVNGIRMPVHSYRFSAQGEPLHVFYCYWDSRSSYQSSSTAAEEDWTAKGRLGAAWNGKREIGAQMLEIVVWGFQNDDDAHRALHAQLTKVLRPEK